MMMVDDVVPLLRPKHDWDQVFCQKGCAFLGRTCAPPRAHRFDGPHTHGDLGGAQILDRHGLKQGFADSGHLGLLTLILVSLPLKEESRRLSLATTHAS